MNNYTPEEIQLLKNIKQRKGTEQEGISALNAYRNSKTQQVQQEPHQENKMFGISSDEELLKKLKEAGVQKDEALKIAEDINNFDKLSIVDMVTIKEKLSKYGILEKTSFQKLKEMGKAGLTDYVAEGIRSVGQPFVQAGEFIQEKAIDPLVKGSVATMQAITSPLQSGLRKLIGEDNIAEMQADIDSTLNNASDDIKDFWNSLSEETKERNKLLFEALVPVLMVAGAVKAKAPMSAIAKSKADDAINLIAKNEKKAIEIAQKEYKIAENIIEKSKKDFGDKKFTNEILKSTQGDKDTLTEMIDIAVKNTEELAPDMLPEDLVGEELGNRLQYVYDNVQKLGKQKGEIIDTIADQKVDIEEVVNSFKDNLVNYGVEIKKVANKETGLPEIKFNFEDSRLRNDTGAQPQIKDFFEWATKKDGSVKEKTVKQLDSYRGNLFDVIKKEQGKNKQFTDFFTNSLKDVRSKLEEPIANLSDDFRKVNTQYAQARSGLEDTFKSLGYKKSVEELPKNIRKMSEFSRRTLGRASNEATNAIDKITEVAESLGYKSDKNIKRLSAFGEALTQKFGTPQSTSFKEQIRQGINPSDITPQGAISKIAKGIEKVTAETPEQAISKQAQNLKDVIGASTTIKKLAKKAQSPIPKTNSIIKTISNKVPIAGEAIQKNKLLTGLAGASSAISETLKNKR